MGKPRPGFSVWDERRIPPADKAARDRKALAALGQAKSWEYAQRVGCSEQTAKNRLRRLYEAGLATRRRDRGEVGWTYEAK